MESIKKIILIKTIFELTFILFITLFVGFTANKNGKIQMCKEMGNFYTDKNECKTCNELGGFYNLSNECEWKTQSKLPNFQNMDFSKVQLNGTIL